MQSKGLSKAQVTVLNTIDPDKLFVGCKCNSVYPDNGMWYPCTILKEIIPTQEDEQKMLETGDFRLLQNKYSVKYFNEDLEK